MKILFDENTPAPLASFFRGHEVRSVAEMGWRGLANGVLLNAAEADAFDVLLTCDQNVPYQQNLANRRVAIIVLSSNHWPTLRGVAARIAAAVEFAQAGQVLRIDVSAL